MNYTHLDYAQTAHHYSTHRVAELYKKCKMSKDINHNFKNVFKKGDILLLIILFVAIVLTIVFSISNHADSVEIYVNGNLAYQLDINSNSEIELLGGEMTIKIQNKKVWVSHSNCAEQLCVLSSPISSKGGMIVCLPNKVVIKLKTKGIDAVT